MKAYDDLPILTCSTESSRPQAIAILRFSGFKNLSVFTPFISLSPYKIRKRFAHRTQVLDGKKALDDAILLFFPAPNSYTGENLLELHIHGNPLNIDRIEQLFLDSDKFRRAEPGEFTFRAYKNKKLTLSQVEGLDLFIHAQSPLALDQGLGLLSGELHQHYQELYSHYLNMRSCLELMIDFSDDVGSEAVEAKYLDHLNHLSSLVSLLEARSNQSGGDLLNPQIILYGPTNSGKSTFFNLLLRTHRAIVSPIAGTTRDFISESLSIGGVTYRLLDTAGIRETHDQIEGQGIEFSRELLQKSFFKIALFNARHEWKSFAEILDEHVFDLLIITHGEEFNEDDSIKHQFPNLPVLVVELLSGRVLRAFGPIGPEVFSAPIEPLSLTGPIGPNPSEPAPIGPVFSLISQKYQLAESNQPLLIKRHCQCIKGLSKCLLSHGEDLRDFSDLAILDRDISILGDQLSDLIGLVPPEDILNNIFQQFCIGK